MSRGFEPGSARRRSTPVIDSKGLGAGGVPHARPTLLGAGSGRLGAVLRLLQPSCATRGGSCFLSRPQFPPPRARRPSWGFSRAPSRPDVPDAPGGCPWAEPHPTLSAESRLFAVRMASSPAGVTLSARTIHAAGAGGGPTVRRAAFLPLGREALTSNLAGVNLSTSCGPGSLAGCRGGGVNWTNNSNLRALCGVWWSLKTERLLPRFGRRIRKGAKVSLQGTGWVGLIREGVGPVVGCLRSGLGPPPVAGP